MAAEKADLSAVGRVEMLAGWMADEKGAGMAGLMVDMTVDMKDDMQVGRKVVYLVARMAAGLADSWVVKLAEHLVELSAEQLAAEKVDLLAARMAAETVDWTAAKMAAKMAVVTVQKLVVHLAARWVFQQAGTTVAKSVELLVADSVDSLRFDKIIRIQ